MWLMVLFCACSEKEADSAEVIDTEMSLDGYDLSCSTASDCTAVFLGSVCGCVCTYGAINSNDYGLQNPTRKEQPVQRK